MKTIEIIVSTKGESQVETKGFTGNGCREASKFIESALGKNAGETLKPEFHIQNPAQILVENSN
ncbi:DUF2997 domain-containing protein [Mariniblastus sp.]|nr:DUF2997 domain-containing protein [Mariniblastus sp.]